MTSRILKMLTLSLVICSCLAPQCDNQGQVKLPTEEQLRKALKPNQKLVYYERELLPGLNREIVRARILDEETNDISEIIRTTKKGERLDYLKLRDLNRSAIRSQHGAGGPGFDAAMDRKPERELLFTVQLFTGASPAQAKRELHNSGATIKDSFSNLISIRASPAAAKTIAHLASVEAIIEEKPPMLQALDMARDLDQAPLAPKHGQGWGRDLLTAIWETDACINRNHPDFQRVQWENRFTPECDPRAADVPFHSTMVAGVFAAFRPDGVAGLFQGRMFEVDDNVAAAKEDMWARKPNIVNASFTTSVFDGMRIDQEVRAKRIHVFNGVGNKLTNGDQIACFGYNALCVGGYVQNVVGAYSDDALGPSSWQNHFGVEKPQILGPYVGGKLPTQIFSGGQPQYLAKNGSSFATPAVSALAALLITNYAFDLTRQPEAVRAVLMASANVHPIVSEGRTFPDFNDAIDDRMGVGAPNGTRAKAIMDQHTMRYGSFLPALPATLGEPVVFPARRGESVRVVFVWDQCPDYNVADPQLSVDLDMVVTAPGLPGPGSTRAVFTNFSRRDNWEIVQFTMPRSGQVTIKISAPSFRPCPPSPNPNLVNYGLAWSILPATLQG